MPFYTHPILVWLEIWISKALLKLDVSISMFLCFEGKFYVSSMRVLDKININ
jgi:hypothetical protein